MNHSLKVPVAPGELLDKISILQIKAERINDPSALVNVQYELKLLTDLWESQNQHTETINQLRADLKGVNEQLWKIEDDIRDCERAKHFGDEFIELARAVYKTNDKRAAIKKQINLELGSAIVEEKSYQKY